MEKIAALTVVCLAAPFLIGAVILPEWQQQIKTQMKKDHDCEVKNFSKVNMAVVNGKESVEARVVCADGRVFDASRQGKGGPFAVKQCNEKGC